MNAQTPHKKKKVVIAGGGTSGWLAAAAISKLVGRNFDISLIESEAIGRIGVGEATIPPLRTFHKLLGINERDFMSKVQATFKLGIEFINWGRKGDNYIHSFGVNGKDCWACDFQHFWLAGLRHGIDGEIGQYCLELMAARQGKVLGGDDCGVNYAYHLDAGLYAEYLKQIANQYGVKLVEGIIQNVVTHAEDGFIKELQLVDGRVVEGDFFIDCTGFSARLIEGALNVSYEPYGHFLPCDSAVAVQTESTPNLRPYTQAIAHDFGWQWRIPLQHRVGNGLVYCSRHVSDDEALATLMNNLESPAITEPRAFKYRTGRRNKAWHKNCVAIGLASGFLEPVESTSIHLAMSGILRLLKLFPQGEIHPSNVDEYNRQTQEEMERVRNFIILHYKATARDDSAFWRYCKDMDIPEALAHRVQLFADTGAVPLQEKELFLVDSWTQVMLGQGIMPTGYHPIVDMMPPEDLRKFLAAIRSHVETSVGKMPSHQAFIDSYCKSAASPGLLKAAL
jgi:tryptophan halogenase